MNFVGQRALVTGAGAGIGRAIALKLAEKGIHVIAVSRTKATLDSLAKENKNIETICVDLANLDQVEKLIGKVLPIQLLVNNAAVLVKGSVLDATEEDFDRSFGINVKAALKISQIVSKDLVNRSMKGSIVNVSSVAGQVATQDLLLYSCTKASLDMMTKTFALELGSEGIRTNSVSPTAVMTEMGKLAWKNPADANKLLSRIPQGRFAEVEEVVNCVMFMLSEESQMVNGHLLTVDGGFRTT